MADYNPKKLLEELKAAGLPVVGTDSTGKVDYSEKLTSSEKKKANEILSKHDPTPPDDLLFLDKIHSMGVTTEQLVYALWRRIMADDPAASERLDETIKGLN